MKLKDKQELELGDAAREAVIDLDLKYEKSAKLHLEKALTSVGEEI